MEGVPEVAEVARLSRAAGLDDRDARIVHAPVRHHSPACARHVRRLILDVRPEAVLIEGPRDATSLIPLILHPATRLPVAIFATFVEGTRDRPARHGAYYPLCEYSPELAALRAAAETGARARFIDLTFPEKVRAARWRR